ncbi:hypothetical protein MFU01_61110 [Myxococcus fulvus]|uniref:Uncharacterized protein n=1 Tax=Myxococcus fulvus TaxID=33 RepID=A0A511TA55_MYXFU|nr:hypothetical protein MFU01_61110 [Myxococcus fulvus]
MRLCVKSMGSPSERAWSSPDKHCHTLRVEKSTNDKSSVSLVSRDPACHIASLAGCDTRGGWSAGGLQG